MVIGSIVVDGTVILGTLLVGIVLDNIGCIGTVVVGVGIGSDIDDAVVVATTLDGADWVVYLLPKVHSRHNCSILLCKRNQI